MFFVLNIFFFLFVSQFFIHCFKESFQINKHISVFYYYLLLGADIFNRNFVFKQKKCRTMFSRSMIVRNCLRLMRIEYY